MACDRCQVVDERRLYAVVDELWYCLPCWNRAGRPWPRRRVSVEELGRLEGKTRQRMLERGGAHRHLVRSGKA